MWTIEEEMARAALAGVDGELGHRLAKEFGDGGALHFVGDVVGEHIDDATGVAFDGAGFLGGFRRFWRGRGHETSYGGE